MSRDLRHMAYALLWATIVTVLVLLLVELLGGCSSSLATERVAADRLARGVNPIVQELAATYQREGDRIIDTAPNGPQAEQALAAHRLRWQLIRDALAVLRTAHDAWATAIERGESASAVELARAVFAAYCALQHALAHADLEWHPPRELQDIVCPEVP